MGWTETRPNGKPIDAGTYCWVTESDGGTNPIYIYGKSVDEVMQKLERTNAHAQAALLRRTTQQPAAPRKTVVFDASHPVEVRPRLSADETMRATQDLGNAGKAGSAATALIEDHTGLDFSQLALDNYARVAMAWQAENPDFYPHPANKRLLTITAFGYVGNRPALVKPDHLTQAYEELLSRGELFPHPEDALPNDSTNPPSSTTFPGESQGSARTTERPRGAQRHATAARSTSFTGARPAQPKGPKYTAEEIRRMPEAKARELIASNDREYAESCEFHFGGTAQA